MKNLARTEESGSRTERIAGVRPAYLETLTMVERLHRRLLDVIKDEFDRRGRSDVNAVQALLLFNIGDK
ncbi:MAG: MarR family transcriptional regulator, partial [Roseiarcus sp.]